MKLAGTIGAVALLCATTANATVTFYSNFASFNAAAPSFDTITIPDVGDFEFFGVGDASVTYDGVTFSQSASLGNGDFFNVSPGNSGVRAVISSQFQSSGVANILITLPASVTAFAFDYGTAFGGDVTFKLSDGNTTTFGGGGFFYLTPGFFGVTDSGGITSVLVTSPDLVLNINGVVPVPEAPTWAMMLAGFAGLGFAGYRRIRRAGVTIA
jgi:hypothetical protein